MSKILLDIFDLMSKESHPNAKSLTSFLAILRNEVLLTIKTSLYIF